MRRCVHTYVLKSIFPIYAHSQMEVSAITPAPREVSTIINSEHAKARLFCLMSVGSAVAIGSTYEPTSGCAR